MTKIWIYQHFHKIIAGIRDQALGVGYYGQLALELALNLAQSPLPKKQCDQVAILLFDVMQFTTLNKFVPKQLFLPK